MKTIVIIFICLVASSFAMAQEVPPHTLSEVEVSPPEFKGISPAESKNLLHDYIRKNLVIPPTIHKYNEGTAVIQFMVTPAGNLSDFKVVNSISYPVDQEIIGVLQTTDHMWAPGKHNGKMVAMEKEIAIKVQVPASSEYSKPRNFDEMAKIHFNKAGEKLFVKQKPKQALRSYQNALRYLPYDRSTLTMVALCQLELGNEAEAQACIHRIKKIKDPESPNENLALEAKNLDSYPQFVQLMAEAR